MKRIILALVLVMAIMAATAPVASAVGDGEITYRALTIGIDSYQTNALTGCVNDATRVSEMLMTANDAGAFFQSPMIRSNLQTDEITALFREIQVWGADDDDVMVFYFAGHGYMSDKGNPAIVGKDNKMLKISELIELLDGVPGVKIVVLDCRYAESLVTNNDALSSIEAFDAAVTDTFKDSSTAANYYVFCASTLYKQPDMAQTPAADSYGLVTYYLVQGCGYNYIDRIETDSMPADLNDNGAVSLGEIQDYVSDCIAENDPDAVFDIKTFPATSAYPLMARRATTEVVEVTLPQSEMEIALDREFELDAKIQPANASMRSLYWTSSDLSVVTVDDMGSIRGLKPGTATISVTTTNGLTKSITINVVDVTYVDNMTVNTGRLVLAPNGHAKLSLDIEPANASERIDWASSDETIATVDQNGTVTCHKLGEAIVSATAAESGAETMTTISVVPANQVIRSVEVPKDSYELFVGETKTIQYAIKPKTALDKNVQFVSSDETVATVTGESIVNAVGPGECTIYATASNGFTKNIDIEVKAATIQLSKKSLSLKKGKTATLKVAIKPSKKGVAVTWTSSDPNVATVENGLVRAIAAGEAVITASMGEGETSSASCTVVIGGVGVKNIKVRPQKATIQVGATTQLEVSVAPENATVKECNWKSNKPSVATVDENGLVTGVSAGNAVITASSHNNKKAKTLVKVTPIAATGVKFDQEQVTLVAGLPGQNKFSVNATTEPANAGSGSLKWASSNNKVATVDKTGTITAKSAGTATIRATTSKKQSASCKVTVTANRVVNKKPFTSSEKLLYTSARRMFYKNNKTLVVEMYFVNATNAAIKVPQAGELTLMLADGRMITAKQIPEGKKSLKAGKRGVISYQIKAEEGTELYGLNLVGAAAEIIAEGADPLQTVQVAGQSAADDAPAAPEAPVVPDVSAAPDTPAVPDDADVTPEPIDDAYIDNDSFIDDPFGADEDWNDEGWDDETVMNTADYDLDTGDEA